MPKFCFLYKDRVAKWQNMYFVLVRTGGIMCKVGNKIARTWQPCLQLKKWPYLMVSSGSVHGGGGELGGARGGGGGGHHRGGELLLLGLQGLQHAVTTAMERCRDYRIIHRLSIAGSKLSVLLYCNSKTGTLVDKNVDFFQSMAKLKTILDPWF